MRALLLLICGRDARSSSGIVQTADFETIDEAIREAILDQRHPARSKSAVLAVAGPIDGDEIALTNCPWVVRPQA